jgi:hypothetical protein
MWIDQRPFLRRASFRRLCPGKSRPGTDFVKGVSFNGLWFVCCCEKQPISGGGKKMGVAAQAEGG